MSHLIYKLLLICFFTTTSIFSFGQQKSKLFSDSTIEQDIAELERLVLYKIDSIRAKKKREPLTHHEHLKTSAKHHLIWVKKTGKVVHFQDVKATKTPIRRAKLAGYKEKLIGENLAMTKYEKELKTEKGEIYINHTLEDIADDLVNNIWRKSKGHYKNIIGKEFKDHAIAIAVDTKHHKVYVMQVLGGELKKKKTKKRKRR